MKHIITLALFFLFIHVNTVAQVFSSKYGIIAKNEIELKEYDKDKTADAVVLFDIGKSYFTDKDNSFDVVFERSTRIKIFSEAGLKWANVEIPFYQEGGIYEKVYDIEASTYNFENGKLTKTDFKVSNCYEEKVNESWKLKKFALPDVKAGSVIEFKYKINSQYVFNLRDWEFQWRIPVVYSEYEVNMIPFYAYSWILQGSNKFDEQTSYKDNQNRRFAAIDFYDMVHKYIMRDVPAFQGEEYISSINDYIIKLDFQLSAIHYPSGANVDILTTWPDMIKDLTKHDDFGKYIKKSEKIAGATIDLVKLSNSSAREKFDFVIKYLKANYNWNQVSGKYASKCPKDFVKDKFGNCADINLFAVGLLRALGIKADPVIISTRDHGRIKYDYPFIHFFNYVIITANIDGNQILSDATDIFCANDRIPVRCINDKGLVINGDGVGWVDLQCYFPSELSTAIFTDFDSLSINSDVRTMASEYDAYHFRTTYGENKLKLIDKFEKQGYTVEDSTISVKNQLETQQKYILRYKLKYDPEIINEKIYLSPLLKETIDENPLKQESRNYPIDMTYPVRRVYTSIIKIPDGYKVEHVGDKYDINNDFFQLEYVTENKGDHIFIKFFYFFKNPVYAAEDYLKMKFYFNEIVKRANDKVVLSKI